MFFSWSDEGDNGKSNDVAPQKETNVGVRDGVTAAIIGGLWAWSTIKAYRSPDSFAIAGKYRPSIQALDAIFSHAAKIDSLKGAGSQFGITQQLMGTVNGYAQQRWSVARSVGGMAANPTPMPLTHIWASPQVFKNALKFGSFCCFAGSTRVEALLSELAPFSKTEASQLAQSLVSCRGKLIRAAGLGAGAGLLTSSKAMSFLPLNLTMFGYMIPVNSILMANSFATSVDQLNREIQSVAPSTHKTMWKHIDTFSKNEWPAIWRGALIKYGKWSAFFGIFGGAVTYAYKTQSGERRT